jgi:hypothetical protein
MWVREILCELFAGDLLFWLASLLFIPLALRIEKKYRKTRIIGRKTTFSIQFTVLFIPFTILIIW